jgi:hypothetical protein
VPNGLAYWAKVFYNIGLSLTRWLAVMGKSDFVTVSATEQNLPTEQKSVHPVTISARVKFNHGSTRTCIINLYIAVINSFV